MLETNRIHYIISNGGMPILFPDLATLNVAEGKTIRSAELNALMKRVDNIKARAQKMTDHRTL